MRINQQPENQGPKLTTLIVFVVLSVLLMTVWFREGETGPLHKVQSGTHAIAAPFSSVGEFVTRPFRGFFAWAGDLGVSRTELVSLRSQNETLRKRVAQLEEARLENERLKALVNAAASQETSSVVARVIGRPTNPWEDTITIGLGTRSGVKAGMPVVGPRGLLGQTVDVAGNSSRVRLLTDQRSGVAAMIQRNRAEGVLRGSIDGQLTLDFVSRETTIKAGDVVITSGMGGIYPKGLIIGEVSRVSRATNALYQDILVKGSARVSSLEEVLVLTGATAQVDQTGGE